MSVAVSSADAAKFEKALIKSNSGNVERKSGIGFSRDATANGVAKPASSIGGAFAHAYLQRFGWTSGVGLGKDSHGRRSFLKVNAKADTSGIGGDVAARAAIAKSFELAYNNVAKKIAVNIDLSDSEDESEDDSHIKRSTSRKRKSTPSPAPLTYKQPDRSMSPPAPSMLFGFVRASKPFLSDLIYDKRDDTAPEKLLSQSSNPLGAHRQHLFHSRCSAKLARLQQHDNANTDANTQIPDGDDSHTKPNALQTNEDGRINDETEQEAQKAITKQKSKKQSKRHRLSDSSPLSTTL